MSSNASLAISDLVAEKIGQHGVETYPHECCGALLGHDSDGVNADSLREVLGLHPLINRRDDSPGNRFSVTAEDVRDAEKAAQQQSLEVIGWYHSHPDHPARPSDYDREHAWPWYSYIIVSVNGGMAQDMTSWRLSDDRKEFSPEAIEVHRRATV